MHRAAHAIAIAMMFVACKPRPAGDGAAPPADVPSGDLATVADRYLDGMFERHPARAVELGLHAHDGGMRDVSAAGLKVELAALDEALVQVAAIDPATLSATERVERATLLQAIRGDRFELAELQRPWRNPMFYLDDLNLVPYVSRDYAPLAQRAAAVERVARATPRHLEHAAANLEARLPRTFVGTALLQTQGSIEFAERDVPAALSGLPADARTSLDAALAIMTAALRDYEALLRARLADATDDYALGSDRFVAMLRETQGFEVDLQRLRELGEADLERNFAALEQVAHTIDSTATVAETIAAIGTHKPTDVLRTAQDQATVLRAFIVERGIVSIPSPDIVEVRATPPFMRWNSAFLDGAGVFETAALPSFYYISPPDPSWPAAQQAEYVPSEADLMFTTVHEVWPGHFLHGLHVRANPSRVLKSHWNYATGEGWAHYAEEMMWDEGVGDDPVVHVGQLLNALLRNVRYVSAIGLHTGTMDVEASQRMFRDKALQDEATARQQAMRGTFDPMYLAYTLGKLAIRKLRDDVRAREGDAFSLRGFHDRLLSYGAAPLPAIREAMLGPDAGPVL